MGAIVTTENNENSVCSFIQHKSKRAVHWKRNDNFTSSSSLPDYPLRLSNRGQHNKGKVDKLKRKKNSKGINHKKKGNKQNKGDNSATISTSDGEDKEGKAKNKKNSSSDTSSDDELQLKKHFSKNARRRARLNVEAQAYENIFSIIDEERKLLEIEVQKLLLLNDDLRDIDLAAQRTSWDACAEHDFMLRRAQEPRFSSDILNTLATMPRVRQPAAEFARFVIAIIVGWDPNKILYAHNPVWSGRDEKPIIIGRQEKGITLKDLDDMVNYKSAQVT